MERAPRAKPRKEEMEKDDDAISTIFKSMRVCGGGLATMCCLPFALCGGGPIVAVQEGYRASVLKFGKLDRIVGPGTYYYNPCTESFNLISVQVQTLDVPQQNVITKYNISVVIHAVIYFTIVSVEQAQFGVANVNYAVMNFAQSTLRTVIGENTMDELFNARHKIVARLTQLIDEETEHWGVKVSNVEMKDITIPDNMQRVMAAVAEAQREGAAKVISAEAELRASNTLAEAADIMATNPLTIQLRYFQTLQEISDENTKTIILPSDIGGMLQRSLLGVQAAAADPHGGYDVEKAMAIRRQIQNSREERVAKEKARAAEAEMLIPVNKKE